LVTKNIGAIIIGYFISSNWVKDVFFIEKLYKPKIRVILNLIHHL